MFWTILGYFVMVMVFVTGFAITAFIGCFLVDFFKRRKEG